MRQQEVKLGVEVRKPTTRSKVVETYWIEEPYVKIVIAEEPDGQLLYYVDEVELEKHEVGRYNKVIEFLERELNPRKISTRQDVKEAIEEAISSVMKRYGSKLHLNDVTREKMSYFLRRNLLGFGPIDPIVRDPHIEDLSCNGVGIPLYVWHREYDSIPVNIRFLDKEALDSVIINLSHKAEKHISSAYPIVDGMLYGRDRIAATFREEVTPKGSTFTIRKFRAEPYSIVDLIRSGALNAETAAYFWAMLENRMSLTVIGGTAAGKTTLLNALACLIQPGLKVVTVEETPELNLPHENWVQLVSRSGYGMGSSRVGEIGLFDLVKVSLRYRPDYLVVGEIRGEEAYVLFQALATGHGGMSTLHAENVDYAIKRLTSKPMDIAPAYLPLMNIVCLVQRVYLPLKTRFERRLRMAWEIASADDIVPIVMWDPASDTHRVELDRSHLLHELSVKLGLNRSYLINDVYEKAKLLTEWDNRNIRSVPEVAQEVRAYYIRRRGRTAAEAIVTPVVEIEREDEQVQPSEEQPISKGGFWR
ncbi:MAG: type II/IV secretion system ATPase subunit [Nitrososphaerota archaeon]